MKLKTAHILKNVCNYLAILLAALTMLLELGRGLERGMLIGAVVLVVVAVVLSVSFCRCPNCGALISRMGRLPERCGNCKEQIKE